jgi:hypothetical protein
MLALIGLGLATWVIVGATTATSTPWTRANAEAFLLTPSLSLAFIPFLYAVWLWSRWDRVRVMRHWEAQRALAELTNG